MKTMKFLSVLLAAAFLSMGTATSQEFVMRLSSPTINDVTHEWMKAFKAGVEERSKGRIKVEIYPANQLGQIPATVEGVALGTIQFTVPAVGFLIGLEPRFQTLDAAGLFDSVEHGQKVLTDPEIRDRLKTFGEERGVEPLITFLNGPMMLLSHKAIRSVNDFRGQKLRSPGAAPLHIEPVRKLGASPISMPLGEVLPAMQNRTIDGVITAFVILTAFKYYDIAKGATFLPGTFAVAAGIVNRTFMKSLGPELEAIVRDEAKKHEALFLTYGIEDLARIRQTWEKNGGEVIMFSPEQAKLYVQEVSSVVPSIVARSSKMKEDYEALLRVAQKYRK
jgi:TRAP-type C4-dicarboxylate transport system substrate-binding protein